MSAALDQRPESPPAWSPFSEALDSVLAYANPMALTTMRLAACQELARLAAGLQQLVSRFRI
jgi:methyl-accepting chemotaxis protein